MVGTTPRVKHVSEEVIAVAHVNHVMYLFDVFDRFECLLEPLFESNSHLIVPYFLKNSNKSFECRVAALVKAAVVEEFIHSVLLALDNNTFNELEGCLRYEKFLMAEVPILRVTEFRCDFMGCGVKISI